MAHHALNAIELTVLDQTGRGIGPGSVSTWRRCCAEVLRCRRALNQRRPDLSLAAGAVCGPPLLQSGGGISIVS